MTQSILSASNLTYHAQGKAILNQCSLSLHDNEVVALIGVNGAGKTTLLHLLAGMKSADSGRIHRSVKQNHWLGFLPDKAPLYPSMRVAEFLGYCASIRSVKSIDKAVDDMVELCALESVIDQRCGSLSHGYQQRVGLAQALIHEPQIIFLDEPTNGLDYGQKKALRPLLAALGKYASVLMISHDYEEIIATAKRIYLLKSAQMHEIVLPDKEGLWWLTLPDRLLDTVTDKFPFDIAINEGKYLGLDKSRYTLAEIYHHLNQANIPARVESSYPVAALQTRIDNVD